ncbi:MAG: pentapeptide repeat-containing protein [Alphaproteobacteria bacterium]|nr:pentapeptide repeat-containing protein [Alphaproteobacteria bacterium]
MSEKRSGEREGKRKREWPYFVGVGLSVFGGGLALWTSLPWVMSKIFLSPSLPVIIFWELNLEEYLTGLILLGLAGLTAGFTYWRGQQTREQIEKAQRQVEETQRQADIAQQQVEETQRQTRNQGFNDAVRMTVDRDNLVRAAGWKLLHLWFEREESEDRSRYLEMIRTAAHGVLRLGQETDGLLTQDMEQLQKQSRKSRMSWLSWEFGGKRSLERSDATRADRDVRQQSLDFLIAHPQQEEGRDMNLRRCDLSDLTLSRDLIKQHRPGERLEIHANGSHCLGMRVDPEADLSGSNFSSAKMMGARFSNFSIIEAFHAEKTGAKLQLEGANLSDTRFIGTDLRHSDLSGVNLNKALLSAADLRHCSLLDADLTGADLTKSDLRGTTLLTKGGSVRFYRTRINAANFRGIEGVSTHEMKALLKGCWWDRKDDAFREPYLPEGIDADDIPDSPDKTVPTGG